MAHTSPLAATPALRALRGNRNWAWRACQARCGVSVASPPGSVGLYQERSHVPLLPGLPTPHLVQPGRAIRRPGGLGRSAHARGHRPGCGAGGNRPAGRGADAALPAAVPAAGHHGRPGGPAAADVPSRIGPRRSTRRHSRAGLGRPRIIAGARRIGLPGRDRHGRLQRRRPFAGAGAGAPHRTHRGQRPAGAGAQRRLRRRSRAGGRPAGLGRCTARLHPGRRPVTGRGAAAGRVERAAAAPGPAQANPARPEGRRPLHLVSPVAAPDPANVRGLEHVLVRVAGDLHPLCADHAGTFIRRCGADPSRLWCRHGGRRGLGTTARPCAAVRVHGGAGPLRLGGGGAGHAGFACGAGLGTAGAGVLPVRRRADRLDHQPDHAAPGGHPGGHAGPGFGACDDGNLRRAPVGGGAGRLGGRRVRRRTLPGLGRTRLRVASLGDWRVPRPAAGPAAAGSIGGPGGTRTHDHRTQRSLVNGAYTVSR